MKYTVEGKLVFTFDGTVEDTFAIVKTMQKALDTWKMGELKDIKFLGLGQYYDVLDESGKSIVKVKEE